MTLNFYISCCDWALNAYCAQLQARKRGTAECARHSSREMSHSRRAFLLKVARRIVRMSRGYTEIYTEVKALVFLIFSRGEREGKYVPLARAITSFSDRIADCSVFPFAPRNRIEKRGRVHIARTFPADCRLDPRPLALARARCEHKSANKIRSLSS